MARLSQLSTQQLTQGAAKFGMTPEQWHERDKKVASALRKAVRAARKEMQLRGLKLAVQDGPNAPIRYTDFRK
jgi:hypothetical protein